MLNGYVNQALRDGSGPVTVIGYSAGGVVAWLWDADFRAAGKVRRFITLGSPLHGANLAALGEAFVPGECPTACQQLVPGSALLTALQDSPAGRRPPWLSLWTTDDQVVQPPDSARLAGAVNVPLQSVCPGVSIQHGQLPTDPLVVGIVLRSLSSDTVSAPPQASAIPCRLSAAVSPASSARLGPSRYTSSSTNKCRLTLERPWRPPIGERYHSALILVIAITDDLAAGKVG